MLYYRPRVELADSIFTLLRGLIQERTGLHFDNGRRDLLADKLTGRLLEHGFSSFLDYYYLLKYDAAAEQEWSHLLDALAVPETYFWREFDQVRALVDVIVAEHAAAHRPTPLRIWSAASSTGEEPLSIAIALEEAGWFQRLPLAIYASDASAASIAQARRGIFRERSFRALPESLRARYFTATPEGWAIQPALLNRITWRTANLLQEAEVHDLAFADVIFCRNVFIYFAEEAIRRTVRLFHRRMPPLAYLFTGASESLLKITTDFELTEIGGAFVYVKRPGRQGPGG